MPYQSYERFRQGMRWCTNQGYTWRLRRHVGVYGHEFPTVDGKQFWVSYQRYMNYRSKSWHLVGMGMGMRMEMGMGIVVTKD